MAYFQKRSGSWRAIIKRIRIRARHSDFRYEIRGGNVGQKCRIRNGSGCIVSRKEAENTTLSEALDRYEREVIPGKKGAVQERSRVRIWKSVKRKKVCPVFRIKPVPFSRKHSSPVREPIRFFKRPPGFCRRFPQAAGSSGFSSGTGARGSTLPALRFSLSR